MITALHKFITNPNSFPFILAHNLDKKINGYSRPHYYHIVQNAVTEAKALGLSRISILEFGVAGGNGLVELEQIAKKFQTRLGVNIDVYGFDTGAGLPKPIDHRDLPFQWQEGFFQMNVEQLESRLDSAELVLGNVSTTVPEFLQRDDLAPIGAIAFDLDYYSSTVDALKIFNASEKTRLPRVFCYFDDAYCIAELGVNLAVSEFNQESETRKLSNPLGLTHSPKTRDWGWKIFEFHDFQHSEYNTVMVTDDQLKLS